MKIKEMSAKNVLSRFLRYVSFDTQSDESSGTAPSSAKQLKLLEALVSELQSIGVKNAHLGKGGVLYAQIPASRGAEGALPIGFIAHADTSPDAPGAGVKPQIIRYEGGDVILNKEQDIVFSAETFPEILKYRGEDVIFTDGTTLLGADDKAGVAAIMTMAETLMTHPEIPHAKICIAVTPDEEIGRGTENFDLQEFGAAYAVTIDGGEIGELEAENFNAASALLSVRGVGVHPGYAKGKMVNAVRLAAEFIGKLPSGESPERTEGREGFIHPADVTGDVTRAEVMMIIRDHDKELFEKKKEFVLNLASEMQMENPQAKIKAEIRDSYENMKPYLDKTPGVMEAVRRAYRLAGIEPAEKPIRGGTDGAMLSVKGLPCPNVFAGGLNFHGVYECLPVKSLEKAAEVAVRLAEVSSEVKSLS